MCSIERCCDGTMLVTQLAGFNETETVTPTQHKHQGECDTYRNKRGLVLFRKRGHGTADYSILLPALCQNLSDVQ